MNYLDEASLGLLRNHLREFEGLRLEAYQDQAGVWTIGYGHTASAGPGMRISEAEANELLELDLQWVDQVMADTIKVGLNPSQKAAVAGLIFNIGSGAWRSSTCLKRLNNGNLIGAAEALTWWNKITRDGKKVTSRGLVRRREAEREMMLAGVVFEDDAGGEVSGGEHKPLNKSKEVALSVGGVGFSALLGYWHDISTKIPDLAAWIEPYLPFIVGGFFVLVGVNRLIAWKRGER